MTVPVVLFYAFAVLAILSALGMVLNVRNTVASAMSLVVTMIALAGIYLLLDAPFIAGAQVLIYVGAITVLILFALMMTAQTVMRDARTDRPWKLLAGVLSVVVFVAVMLTIRQSQWAVNPEGPRDTLDYLGRGLLGTYLVAFEVASVLLLVALVGAIVLAKEERA